MTNTFGAEETLPAADRTGASGGRDDARRLEPGSMLGRYVLLSRVGAGGMGVVYAAYDPELDRKVAVKLLHDSDADDDGRRARLLREAQVLAKLSHPHIVAVHDVGMVRDRVWLAMEFVAGHTLTDWLAQGQRSWRDIVGVMVDAGRGLAAAHDAGLVHRDFKPDNVMIDDARQRRVRVMDFGLARTTVARESVAASDTRIAAHRRELDPAVTHAGALRGTPAYMAPEQFRGEAADARTDQYAYCVALWEALFGERPFRGDTYAELVADIVSTRVPVPPRGRSVPARLRKLVLRGLGRDRGERWPSMDALLADLEHDAARMRSRTWLLAASTVVLAGTGLLAVVLDRDAVRCEGGDRLHAVWDDDRAGRVRAAFVASELPFARDAWEGVRDRLDAYRDAWVATHIDACTATHVRAEQSDQLFDLRMHCLARAREDLDALVDLLEGGSADVVAGSLRAAAELPSIRECDDGEALRRDDRRPRDPELLAAVEALEAELASAKALLGVGRYREGSERAQELMARAEVIGHPPTLVRAASIAGDGWSRIGDAARARPILERALVANEDTGDERARAELLTNLVVAVGHEHGDRAVGRLYYEIALGIVRRLGLGPAHEGGTELAVGLLELDAGRFDDALVHFERASELYDLSGDSAHLGRASSFIGSVLFSRGEYRRALPHYARALELDTTRFGAWHPLVAQDVSNLAMIEVELGELDLALEHHRAALAVYDAVGTLDGEGRAGLLTNIGATLFELHRIDEAVTLHLEAMQSLGANAPKSRTHAMVLMNLADARLAQGRSEAALRLFERARDELAAVVEPDHPYVAMALDGIGRARARARVESPSPSLE